ncbi:MAG: precorrin-6Y C5,15-methyltransferase (decarboxylating) subunit CbiT, partial [Oscillospiraceae bacterium]|nr:precorrin-6Y C5,15-methyltransferase (decarboxylating) subunit CbiT [Oscillospiraceae bacterium]
VAKLFLNTRKEIFASYKTEEIAEYIKNSEYKNIAVLMSGDCGFYSGTEKLLQQLCEYETEVICGISAPIYFCSKIKIPWQDMRFISLHGTDANIVRNVCAYKKTFFLLGGKITPSDVCKRLCEYGLKNTRVYIGENLAYENERILSGSAANFADIKTENLCVAIVINPDYEKVVRSCIPDSEFIRADKIPMTKSEVRSICVSKLEIARDSVCWDIGCGTGSVSVEMAYRCTDGKVFSVDKNSAAIKLTEVNRRNFRCDNIEIAECEAEKAVEVLPAADCVFIGGSGRQLEKIIETSYQKNPRVKIVITAVSLETLRESIAVFDKIGIETEITQIAVTRTKKAGSHTMLSAENPVFIIKGAVK